MEDLKPTKARRNYPSAFRVRLASQAGGQTMVLAAKDDEEGAAWRQAVELSAEYEVRVAPAKAARLSPSPHTHTHTTQHTPSPTPTSSRTPTPTPTPPSLSIALYVCSPRSLLCGNTSHAKNKIEGRIIPFLVLGVKSS